MPCDIINTVTSYDQCEKYKIGKTFFEMGVKDKASDTIKKAWELNPFSKRITADL